MAGISRAIAEQRLTLWLEAEASLASSQSYTIQTDGSSRTLTRANLQEVAERITYWQAKVASFDGAAITYLKTSKGF